ncbi:conserved Plasmodium protein, unknown function [Plasmodium malariae]|uniref:Uncharacterized protein n=1 Tax=Plasmodium malariae TaxID=5858 RepID=A0A1D3SQN1_PLAMA|nr:conserved Plasmodium protein, unknown function [Plasmodium malariae]SCO93779.1 conserved Plasmodium protein, unknown function [Plasmodium malariae]
MMNFGTTCEIGKGTGAEEEEEEEEQERFYRKLEELKCLRKIKAKDLISNYLIYLVLFVQKILEKNEESKILTELKNEERKKELIKENIGKIKEKLKGSKNGSQIKAEEIHYNHHEHYRQRGLHEQGDDKKKLKGKSNSPKGDKSSNGGDNSNRGGNNIGGVNISHNGTCNNNHSSTNDGKKCKLVNICNDLTCAFHFCVLLLVSNLKEEKENEKKGHSVSEKRMDGIFSVLERHSEGEDDDNDSGIYSGIYSGIDNNGNKNNNSGKGNVSVKKSSAISQRKEAGKRFQSDRSRTANRRKLLYHLNLVYISVCFYNIYLLNDKDYYFLYISLLLFLNNFSYFKDKTISHYICMNKKVYIKYDISVCKFLFDICKTIGVSYKKKKNIYLCLFFLTYSFLFLKKCMNKNDKCNKAEYTNNREFNMEAINIFQHMNDVFLDLNFFSASTFFVLKSIDMHFSLLKNDMDMVSGEVGGEEMAQKHAIRDATSNGYNSLRMNKDNAHYYIFREECGSDNTMVVAKKRSIPMDEKLKEIMNVTISLYNNITECNYIFLDMHLLSIYEHLVFVSFYMIKDVYKLFHSLKKEKEKKILQEYKYMTYRNLLEIYIIYLKYNYLNYSQTGCGLVDTYTYVNNIYRISEKVKREFYSLLKNTPTNEQAMSEHFSEEMETDRETFSKKYFEESKIFIYDNTIKVEEEISVLYDPILYINYDDLTKKNVSYCEGAHGLLLKRREYNYNEHSFIISDNNFIYTFLYEQILKENNLSFDKEEINQISFIVSGTYEKMSFSKFFQENVRSIDEIVEAIFNLIEKEKSFETCTNVSSDGTINIDIDINHCKEFFQIFHFNKITLEHMKFNVCNFCYSKYNNLAINKMKKMYKNFSKCRDNNREYEELASKSANNVQEEKENNWMSYYSIHNNIHYLCYNYKEIAFLFKNVKKYKKKSFEYFSLFNQTTIHLDILLNSSEAYFYFNFFTKTFDEYIKNYMNMLSSISYPLKYIEHKQYLSYKRELTLKCALLLKDIYICKKCNTLNENIYFKSVNKNKNLNFDDNIFGILTTEQKNIIWQILKYYFSFLNTYPIDKETTNEVLFENEEEKKSYFDIYFYACKTLSTVEDKMFLTQAVHHYQYLLNYSLKNKMYEDEKYNEYMQNVCKKSLYVLQVKLSDIG